jgi:hypothetical protein
VKQETHFQALMRWSHAAIVEGDLYGAIVAQKPKIEINQLTSVHG